MASACSNAALQITNMDINLLDLEPDTDTLLKDVMEGLSKAQKTLPCKYFYDERGAKLFEQICDLPEYYPTRTEIGILRDNITEIAQGIGPNCAVIEPGSGSGIKTRLLLEHLENPSAYIPIDVSKEQLLDYSNTLNADYPELEVLPVCADFTQQLQLPTPNGNVENKLIYFPGSTIGNFNPEEAKALLSGWRELLGNQGSLLIGVDLKKDKATLEAAYNDSQGITADFNLNLLKRINQELDADFDIELFSHEADYDETTGAIRMWLISETAQSIAINDDAEYQFQPNETICTEHSHKYSIEDFERLAAETGWQKTQLWTDPKQLFSIWHLQSC